MSCPPPLDSTANLSAEARNQAWAPVLNWAQVGRKQRSVDIRSTTSSGGSGPFVGSSCDLRDASNSKAPPARSNRISKWGQQVCSPNRALIAPVPSSEVAGSSSVAVKIAFRRCRMRQPREPDDLAGSQLCQGVEKQLACFWAEAKVARTIEMGALLLRSRETAGIDVKNKGIAIESSFNDGHSNLRRCQGSAQKDSKLPH